MGALTPIISIQFMYIVPSRGYCTEFIVNITDELAKGELVSRWAVIKS